MEQFVVHLLDLITLHLVLLLKGDVFLQGELQMGLLTFETVDQGMLRLLLVYELVQLLVCVLDLEILLLDDLLGIQHLLLNLVVSLGLKVTFKLKGLDPFFLVANLRFIFNLD